MCLRLRAAGRRAHAAAQRMRFQHNLRQWEIAAAIGCSQMQVSRIIRTSLERLSAPASMGCGAWSMSDTTEGVTA
jgi:hypothetical protein